MVWLQIMFELWPGGQNQQGVHLLLTKDPRHDTGLYILVYNIQTDFPLSF